MASQSQIVPSKNALRALRKLALGGSTVVGAVGSISGLACVSYDIRQRIHLAESIVETKRVLHSQPISNPNRKAQMAAVFEMYEKGQGKEGNESWRDFSRRARRQSTLENVDNSHEVIDSVTGKEMLPHTDIARRPTHVRSTGGALHAPSGRPTMLSVPSHPPWKRPQVDPEDTAQLHYNQNSPTAQRIIEATSKPHKFNLHTVYGRPREVRDISPVQKIITATQRQHKLPSEVVFGQPANSKDEALPELPSCVQQWLTPTNKPKAGANHVTTLKRPKATYKAMRSDNASRRHSTLATMPQDDGDYPAIWPSMAESQYDDPFFPNHETTSKADEKTHRSGIVSLPSGQKIKTDPAPKKHKIQKTSHRQPTSPGPAMQTATQDVCANLSALIDSVLWTPSLDTEEVYDISAYPLSLTDRTPLPTNSQANESTGTHRTLDAATEYSSLLEQLFTIIPKVRRRRGNPAAQVILARALKIYAHGGCAEDFRAIDKLHLEFAARLCLPFITPIRQLVQFLLNTGLEDDRRRAGRILFRYDLVEESPNEDSTAVREYRYERNVVSYIDFLCSGSASKARVVLDFRKVLEVIYLRGEKPTEAMFRPVLDLFYECGDLKYIRNMFEEMKTVHGIKPTGLTRMILLLGYAKQNDWAQVVTDFEAMHREGMSRKEPMSYCAMFSKVFRQYALSEPVEKTHDFVVNAICYWGLIPSSAISATAVQAYVRHRRYDLIKEWIEAVRHMFPHVKPIGDAFAYELARTWSEIGASCEDIETTCVSILQGADYVVPGRFQAVVQEALARQLARKLQAIRSDGAASDDHPTNVKDTDDLLSQLQSAFEVISSHAGESGLVRHRGVADLLAQSSAVLRLHKFFGGKATIAAPDVKPDVLSYRSTRTQTARPDAPTTDLATPIPEILRRDILPDRETVISLVSDHYSQQLKLGQSLSHDVLKVACRGLEQTGRRHDILCLISHIYQGPVVQGSNGVMFDIDIIQTWMEAAYRLKSAKACKKILTAVLEEGTAIRLTHQFMVLLSMVAKNGYAARYIGRNARLAKEVADLNYVVNRLRDRFYRQRSNPEAQSNSRYEALLSAGKVGKWR